MLSCVSLAARGKACSHGSAGLLLALLAGWVEASEHADSTIESARIIAVIATPAEATPGGMLVQREQLTSSWFVTEGRFAHAALSRAQAIADNALELPAAVDSAQLRVVLRADRGRSAVQSLSATLARPTVATRSMKTGDELGVLWGWRCLRWGQHGARLGAQPMGPNAHRTTTSSLTGQGEAQYIGCVPE